MHMNIIWCSKYSTGVMNDDVMRTQCQGRFSGNERRREKCSVWRDTWKLRNVQVASNIIL